MHSRNREKEGEEGKKGGKYIESYKSVQSVAFGLIIACVELVLEISIKKEVEYRV